MALVDGAEGGGLGGCRADARGRRGGRARAGAQTAGVDDDRVVAVEAAEHLLVLGREDRHARVLGGHQRRTRRLVGQRGVLELGDLAELFEPRDQGVVGLGLRGEVWARRRQASGLFDVGGLEHAAREQAEQQGRDLRDVGVVLLGQQLVGGAAAVDAAQEVQLLRQQVERLREVAGPARGDRRVLVGDRLELHARALVGPALLHAGEHDRLDGSVEAEPAGGRRLAAGLELEAALFPAEDLEQLDAQLLVEAVAEVALGEDAHLDQQLALLLAGASDRLERVVALLLGDEALVGQDLPEELRREVRADQRRHAVDEEDDLLRLAHHQVEVAGRARLGDVADQVREGHALEGSLGREPEVAVGGCLRRHEGGPAAGYRGGASVPTPTSRGIRAIGAVGRVAGPGAELHRIG